MQIQQRSATSNEGPFGAASVMKAATPRSPIAKGALAAAAAGNALEFYDFLTYSFFALYIGKAFFPTDSAFASLLLSVATFGIGFLTRPIGGVLIGAYADRVGRKPALLLTIGLMAAGTLAIVVTPSYASIGVAAPFILVAARLLQGLAIGGEVGPASAVLLEGAPPGQRALYSSLQPASQGAAAFAAGVVGLTLATVLSKEQLESWGWRVPFALGLLIVPVGFFLRRSLPETLEVPAGERSSTEVLGVILQRHRRPLVLMVLVAMCLNITSYVVIYMTTYAQSTLGMPPSSSMLVPVVVGLVGVPAAIFGGRLSDRFGRRRVMIVSRVAVMAIIYPAFLFLVRERTATALVLATALLGLLGAPGGVAVLTAMGEIFPSEVRSSGMSLAYATSVTVFGGTTQFAIARLVGVTGNPLAPALYVMGASEISLWTMFQLPENRHRF